MLIIAHAAYRIASRPETMGNAGELCLGFIFPRICVAPNRSYSNHPVYGIATVAWAVSCSSVVTVFHRKPSSAALHLPFRCVEGPFVLMQLKKITHTYTHTWWNVKYIWKKRPCSPLCAERLQYFLFKFRSTVDGNWSPRKIYIISHKDEEKEW